MAKITLKEIVDNTTGNESQLFDALRNYGNFDYFLEKKDGENSKIKLEVEESFEMWKDIAMSLGIALSLDYVNKENLKSKIVDAADKWIERNL